MSPLHILLIEDNEHDQVAFRRAFAKADVLVEIVTYQRAEQALATLSTDMAAYDVVVVDYKLPGMTGLDFCRKLLKNGLPFPLVLLTGVGTESLAVAALKVGVSDYIVKDYEHGYLELLPVLLPDVVRRHQEHLAHNRALQALQESEARYRTLFEQARDALHVADAEDNIVDVNQKACELFGYDRETLLTMSVADLQAPEVRQNVGTIVTGELDQYGSSAFETVDIRADGTRIPVEVSVASLTGLQGGKLYLSIVRDITERKLAEQQLREYTNHLEERVEEKVRELERERAKALQMDKMASLGQIATGVAHELNQPLTAISMEADYLYEVSRRAMQGQMELLGPETLAEMGENLHEDVLRCRRIIDHLRTFGRVSEETVTFLPVNQPIQDSLILVGMRLREHGVDVQLDLAEDLPMIWANTYRLEQVFLNLMGNAEYALEEMAQRVRAGEVDCSRYRKILKITTRVQDERVWVEICDNGIGVPPEVQGRIFEPFVTTKPPGQGTGLGLSISADIVAEFGGEITFESVENQGTTFILSFPVATQPQGTMS